MPGLDASGLAGRWAGLACLARSPWSMSPDGRAWKLPRAGSAPFCRIPMSLCPTPMRPLSSSARATPSARRLSVHEMGASRVVITRGQRGLVSVSEQHQVWPYRPFLSRSSTAPAGAMLSTPATSWACLKHAGRARLPEAGQHPRGKLHPCPRRNRRCLQSSRGRPISEPARPARASGVCSRR